MQFLRSPWLHDLSRAVFFKEAQTWEGLYVISLVYTINVHTSSTFNSLLQVGDMAGSARPWTDNKALPGQARQHLQFRGRDEDYAEGQLHGGQGSCRFRSEREFNSVTGQQCVSRMSMCKCVGERGRDRERFGEGEEE